MIEPVATQDLMAAAIAGALIVLFGALYALFYALARLQNRSGFLAMAFVAYAALAFAVVVLALTLNMTGFWQIVAAVMLIGYLAAPQIVWRLCVGTHNLEELDIPDVRGGH